MEIPSLADRIPGGAYAFIETSGLSDLIGSARGSQLLDGVLQSEDFAEIRMKKWFKDIESSKKLAEFVLRMSLWEASTKLLGGRVGVAIYPGEGKADPEVALVVRPSEPSEWLKRRVWSAPLLRIGLKRISRSAFGDEVAAYRTRGFNKDGATYFALHDQWIAVASNESLLKKTVTLQSPGGTRLDPPGDKIGDELPYQRMTKRMGTAHFGRAFIDTQRLSKLAKSAGPNFGLPEDASDPMLSLFLGGVTEMLDSSRFAGFVLDLKGKEVRFSAGIDARPGEIGEKYRIFFSENPGTGMRSLPAVAGLIGGFTLYRQFGSWYQSRDDLFKDSLIPGVEGFQGNIGEILLGKSDASGKSVVGDQIAFVAAMRGDAGAEPNGAALPGFAFAVELATPGGADTTIAAIFEAVLDDIRVGREGKLSWEHGETVHLGVPVKFAKTRSGGRTLVPAIARVGDQLIVSSSRELCLDLIGEMKNLDRPLEEGKDLVFHLHSAPLHSLLDGNRNQYYGQLVRGGQSPKQALDSLRNLENLLATFSSLQGSSTAANGIFEINLLGQLK